MRKIRKNLISFISLTENQKDNILEYIREEEVSIRNAALHFNVTSETINRIFTERFGKRTEVKKSTSPPRREYYKKYWVENKLK